MQIGDRPKFYWCAAAGLMGVLVTLLFIPEVTDLDLREGDRRWEHIKTGSPPSILASYIPWHPSE